jgi:hypothetical protein
MADKSSRPAKPKTAQTREDRLKSALKANLARRKAQARARAEPHGDTGKPEEQKD